MHRKLQETTIVNILACEQEYLQQHSYPQDKQKAVLDIIQGIGFKVQSCFPAKSCNCLLCRCYEPPSICNFAFAAMNYLVHLLLDCMLTHVGVSSG